MPEESKPDSLRTLFGARLRRRRVERDLSLDRLAREMGYSPQWLHQMETTDKAVSAKFAEDCATYFIDPDFTEIHGALSRENRRTYLSQPQNFSEYIELEQQASVFRSFAVNVVPGLLQTEDYIRTMMTAGMAHDGPEVAVAKRMGRKPMLVKQPYVQFEFVFTESGLSSNLGGARVMREQMEALLNLAQAPNISIRIIPPTPCVVAALDGPFTILTLVDGREILYVEAPEMFCLIEDHLPVSRGIRRFGSIMGEALPAAASAALIQQYRRRYLADEEAEGSANPSLMLVSNPERAALRPATSD